MASLKKKFEQIDQNVTKLTFDPFAMEGDRMMQIPIGNIVPDIDNPRKEFGDIEDLKASIRNHGVIQPLVVRKVSDTSFQIIAGERRFRALVSLQMEWAPCVVRSYEEHKLLEVQLVENLHRRDLNPVEEAAGYKRLMEDFDLSQRDVAVRFGKSPASISETLKILDLPADILENVRTSEQTTKSVLLMIAKEESEKRQRDMWDQALSGGLTVRKAKSNQPIKTTKRYLRKEIETQYGTVSVRVEGEELPPKLIIQALEEALFIAKGQSIT